VWLPAFGGLPANLLGRKADLAALTVPLPLQPIARGALAPMFRKIHIFHLWTKAERPKTKA
jgi:hypothetical protein